MKQKELYVLTGFLGAGKTSVLLHLLDNITDGRIGVIQNEFGKLSIDGEIIKRGDITMREISRGSIFCTCLKLSFVQALAEMGAMELDCVFVESSGLADPSNIQEILDAVRELAGEEYYVLKGVICLIDGVNFIDQLEDIETVERQLSHCHMAAVNKLDLIDEEQLEKVRLAVRAVNPVCGIITCINGRIPLDFLDRDLTALQFAPWESSHNTMENKPKTFSLESAEPVSKETLTAFLNQVLPECYRIKGFFHLEDGWNQVDVVEKWIGFKPSSPRDISQLVFLSKIGPKAIRTVDNAWRETAGTAMKLRN